MPNTPVTLNIINNNVLAVKAELDTVKTELDTLFALLKADLIPLPGGSSGFCHKIINSY